MQPAVQYTTASDGVSIAWAEAGQGPALLYCGPTPFSHVHPDAPAVEPLHIRVGLNAGEPIEEDGDLFGSTVILASRVAAKAGAGEILIPEPVRHLLVGKSFVFSDRGEFAMKDFDDAVRLYEVRWRE